MNPGDQKINSYNDIIVDTKLENWHFILPASYTAHEDTHFCCSTAIHRIIRMLDTFMEQGTKLFGSMSKQHNKADGRKTVGIPGPSGSRM
jgi:hypothetical protein